jgi:hypothetical protein
MRHRATQHGIRADAAEILSQFEKMVNELKRSHPDCAF